MVDTFFHAEENSNSNLKHQLLLILWIPDRIAKLRMSKLCDVRRWERGNWTCHSGTFHVSRFKRKNIIPPDFLFLLSQIYSLNNLTLITFFNLLTFHLVTYSHVRFLTFLLAFINLRKIMTDNSSNIYCNLLMSQISVFQAEKCKQTQTHSDRLFLT